MTWSASVSAREADDRFRPVADVGIAGQDRRMIHVRRAIFALVALSVVVGEPLHAATPPVTAYGPDHQINMYIVSQKGAQCTLTRSGAVIWQTKTTIPEAKDLAESKSFFIGDAANNHDPITVECSARGFEIATVTVEYVHNTGVANVMCVRSDNMTDQERRAAEACERQTSGKTILEDYWSYPERVFVHLPAAR